MDFFLGMITVFGFSWTPVSFDPCQGQEIAINQNEVLFTVIGNKFGGNGATTFKYPDLRGRMAVGQGTNPRTGVTYQVGQIGGVEAVTLTMNQMPAHTHTASVTGSSAASTTDTPAANAYPAKMSSGIQSVKGYVVNPDPATLVTMGGATTSMAGGGHSVNTMSPYLVLNPVIAIQGLYPSRS